MCLTYSVSHVKENLLIIVAEFYQSDEVEKIGFNRHVIYYAGPNILCCKWILLVLFPSALYYEKLQLELLWLLCSLLGWFLKSQQIPWFVIHLRLSRSYNATFLLLFQIFSVAKPNNWIYKYLSQKTQYKRLSFYRAELYKIFK